ncbi:probable beta-hexosaminidase fdl [Glossina fuscipes]|uniref:beta-N-acetylhexosaminidase n=1 Tax=Glossina fuscipes TaxID=7396 RepID=A0A9C5ZAN2_9MUSC|nr:probable beta-hexosaminidase fdl [Glossina fuscipes]
MGLFVAVLKTLIILLSVAYSYQNGATPKLPDSINTMDLEINSVHNGYSDPAENQWVYKCVNNKCIRTHNHDLRKLNKSMSLLTCSMTCGDVKLWPYPTTETQVKMKPLKFTLDALLLRLHTPYSNVRTYFRSVFKIFLDDLKGMQRQKTFKNFDHDKIKSTKDPIIKYDEISVDLMRNSTCNESDIDIFPINVFINKYPDLSLSLDTDESYELHTIFNAGRYEANITANSFFGARHALSTLQQLMWFDERESWWRTLSKIDIVDAPRFRYRGLMLDTSRHYISIDAIKRTIGAMSHAKLNRFHWHITDSQSFPYVSKHYPELAEYGAYSREETYTLDDIRDVTSFAKLRGIQIITEIDAPAHAGNGWDWGPKKGLGDLSLCINQQPWTKFCGQPPCGQLNPKNNNTFLVLQKLYEELLDATETTDYFHLGGDEVNMNCWKQHFEDSELQDLWYQFTLDAADRLTIANKNITPKFVTVWSSDLTKRARLPRSRFAVQVWTGNKDAYALLRTGYNVVFSQVSAWYFDCGFGSYLPGGVGVCDPYRSWQVVYGHRPWEKLHPYLKQILGGEACLWTEQVSEWQLDTRFWPRAAALGERLWSDPKQKIRDVFKRMSIFRNRLVDLGIKAEAIFPQYCAENPGECD